MDVHVLAPGRVNLIGDHTDYTGGLVMPMAIDRFIELHGTRGGDRVRLTSRDERDPVDVPLHIDHPEDVTPPWGRYVAGVVAELGPEAGLSGSLETDIPIGAGLSSSAALEVAVALALGANPDPRDLAALCRRAEHRATGVPCGIMDQLTVAGGVAEHALLIDCHSLDVKPIRVPGDVEVIVLFVMQRALATSFYAQRVAESAAAEAVVGPLREATLESLDAIDDRIVRARATHVVSENQRVRDFAETLQMGALEAAGRLMIESHESLRDLFATSTPEMDSAVAQLRARPGVYGARMTGGGFGGCVVALTEPGALSIGWVVRPVDGAQMAVR